MTCSDNPFVGAGSRAGAEIRRRDYQALYGINWPYGNPWPLKSRSDLFPPKALALAGEVLAFGESKHPSEPWKTMSSEEHMGAVFRHILEHQAGNRVDTETSKPHLAHALVRLAMALERHLDSSNS